MFARFLPSILVLVALVCFDGLDAASVQTPELSILKNPTTSQPDELRRVINEQKQAITKLYRSGENQDQLMDKVKSLLNVMEGATTDDKDYLRFQAFLMNMSSRIQGEMGNFGAALVAGNVLVKFCEAKLDADDLDLAHYVLDSMLQGLRESFEDLRAELRGSKGNLNIQQAYEDLVSIIPKDNLELMDVKSVHEIAQMEKDAKAELKLMTSK